MFGRYNRLVEWLALAIERVFLSYLFCVDNFWCVSEFTRFVVYVSFCFLFDELEFVVSDVSLYATYTLLGLLRPKSFCVTLPEL